MRPTGGDKAIARKKQYFRRKKLCRFCVEKIDDINYKDIRLLNVVHLRARQDYAPPHLGRLRAAPAALGGSDQAGAQHRAAAVRGAGLGGRPHGSHSQRRHRKAREPRRSGESGPRVRAQFSASQELAVAATESNKKIVEQERQAHLRREAKAQDEAQDLGKMLASSHHHDHAARGRRRPTLRLGHRQGYRRCARAPGLQHRPQEDPSGDSDQDTGEYQGTRPPASRSDHRRPSQCHRGSC